MKIQAFNSAVFLDIRCIYFLQGPGLFWRTCSAKRLLGNFVHSLPFHLFTRPFHFIIDIIDFIIDALKKLKLLQSTNQRLVTRDSLLTVAPVISFLLVCEIKQIVFSSLKTSSVAVLNKIHVYSYKNSLQR